MNPRIELIFRLARQTLGDKDGDRWSDTDLLDLLDQGHKDFAHAAHLLRGTATIPLVPFQAEYQLPKDVHILLRAETEQGKLTLTSYDAMDEAARDAVINNRSHRTITSSASDFGSLRPSVNWQADEGGEPLALIYDKSNMDTFRVYPIVNSANLEFEYPFSNESGITLPFVGAEYFGVVTKIGDYTFDSPYGVVTDLYDPFVENEVFDTTDGVVTGIGESTGKIIIRYIKTPDTLVNVDSELLTPRSYDLGLKYYITGHALRNDIDTRNVERGMQELAFYERELQNASRLKEQNAVHTVDRTTSYRSGF